MVGDKGDLFFMDVRCFENNPDLNTIESGIYGILYIRKNKIYIGSAANFKRRKKGHLDKLSSNSHGNIYLQNIYNKYGKNELVFVILEKCDKQDLLIVEQKWIDTLNIFDILLNICKVAGSRMGSITSEETREKLRISSTGRVQTEEARRKISETHKGKKKSPSHVEKMRNIFKGRKRTKEAIQKSNEGHYKKIAMHDLKTDELLKEFPSIIHAHKYLNKNKSSSISQVAKGKRASAYGYKWKFIE